MNSVPILKQELIAILPVVRLMEFSLVNLIVVR